MKRGPEGWELVVQSTSKVPNFVICTCVESATSLVHLMNHATWRDEIPSLENKEHNERLSVGGSSCVQMVVICDQKLPRLCSVTGQMLCEASHSHGDSRPVIRVKRFRRCRLYARRRRIPERFGTRGSAYRADLWYSSVRFRNISC